MPAGGNRSSLAGLVASLTAPFRRPPTTSATPPRTGGGAPIFSYSFGQQARNTGNDPTALWGNQSLSAFDNVFTPGQLFGPGRPLVPTDYENVRRWNYPVGYDTIYTPRSYEPIGFAELRALADSHDITRLAIETRKDQIERLEWQIKPISEKEAPASAVKRVAAIEKFWRSPDGDQSFAAWLREALEDVLVIDAPAFEIRRTRGGDIIGLDIVDGSTIKVLIDETGRWPKPPAPAYEQVIHGRPWRLLTRDQLIYSPRNRRSNRAYGFSPVEQILLTINIGLRRELKQLHHFTEGNVPIGLVKTPDTWNPEQIRQYQEWFDSVLAGNSANQVRVFYGPGDYKPFVEAPYKDSFDEWLARIVCYAFSLPPTAFVTQVNRATAESSQEAAVEEGQAPLMGWVKRFADDVIQNRMGQADLEFSWTDTKETDPVAQAATLVSLVKEGIRTRNEARGILGEDPIKGGDEATVDTAQGPVPVKNIEAMGEMALNPPEPTLPPRPDAGAGEGAPGGGPAPDQNGAGKPAANGKPANPQTRKPAEATGSNRKQPEATGSRARAGKPPANAAVGKVSDTEVAAKRSGPFGASDSPSFLRQARDKIERSVAAFLSAEAGRVAHEALTTRKASDHTDPGQSGVTPAQQDDRSRAIEALVAAALARITFGRWAGLIGEIGPQLLDVAEKTVDETLAELGVAPTAGEAADLQAWAKQWAHDRAAELVGKKWIGGQAVATTEAQHDITSSTLDMITADVREAITTGSSAIELAAALAKSGAFSPQRAKGIADYETKNALHEATLKAFHASNVVTGSSWVTMGDGAVEELCLANQAASPVPLGQPFPSGHLRPQAHVNCRCWIEPHFSDVELALKYSSKAASIFESHPALKATGIFDVGLTLKYSPTQPTGIFDIAARLAKRSPIDPEDAIPTTLPQADPVTEADIQHAAWVLVRKDNMHLEERTVPIAALVACGQTVVDKDRVARETAKWRRRGQGKFRPLVMARDDRFLILSGLHHSQAAQDAGATEMRVQVLSEKTDTDC